MLIKSLCPGFMTTKTPVRVGLMAVAANAILNVVFIGFFKLIDWQAEHMALALASSGSALVNVGCCISIYTSAIFSVLAHTGKTIYPVWYF